MTESYIQIWSSLLILAAILGITLFQNLLIAGIMLLLVFVNYFGYKLLNKELARRSEVLQKENSEGFQQLVSFLGQTDYLKQCSDYCQLEKQVQPAVERTMEVWQISMSLHRLLPKCFVRSTALHRR